MKSLYDNNCSRVFVNCIMTDSFAVRSGVKQGCVLSPTLFSFFINDLVQELNDLKCGIDIGNTMISSL